MIHNQNRTTYNPEFYDQKCVTHGEVTTCSYVLNSKGIKQKEIAADTASIMLPVGLIILIAAMLAGFYFGAKEKKQ